MPFFSLSFSSSFFSSSSFFFFFFLGGEGVHLTPHVNGSPLSFQDSNQVSISPSECKKSFSYAQCAHVGPWLPKLKTRPSCTRTVITSPSSEAGIVTLMMKCTISVYFYHHHPLALPLASPNSISNLHSRSSSLTCAHGGCAHCAYSVSASTRGSPSTGSSVLITLNNKHCTFSSVQSKWPFLGTHSPSKTDEFSEKFQRGGEVIFNPKIYVADFCHFRRYFGHEFQKKLQHNFPKMSGEGGVKGRLELFRKFIRFGRGMRPLASQCLRELPPP